MTLFGEYDVTALLYAGIFLGFLIFYEGVRQVMSRSESRNEARNRRMKMIAKGATAEDVLRLMRPTPQRWALHAVPFIGKLPIQLRQAGMAVRPDMFLIGCLTATVATTAVGFRLLGLPIALGASAFLFVVIPILVVRFRCRKRMDEMVRQLPDALDMMARGLRVGHPLNTTIGSVARDMKDPVASEFGVMVDQISYGDDLVSAFMDFAERTDAEDIRYLAVSVAIQHGTGGDLAQVLSTLSQVIRDRINMRKKIMAVSAEGRMTSVFLSLLPVGILVSTHIMSPDYYGEVAEDPLFRPMAITVLVLVISNYLALRKLVDFRI